MYRLQRKMSEEWREVIHWSSDLMTTSATTVERGLPMGEPLVCLKNWVSNVKVDMPRHMERRKRSIKEEESSDDESSDESSDEEEMKFLPSSKESRAETPKKIRAETPKKIRAETPKKIRAETPKKIRAETPKKRKRSIKEEECDDESSNESSDDEEKKFLPSSKESRAETPKKIRAETPKKIRAETPKKIRAETPKKRKRSIKEEKSDDESMTDCTVSTPHVYTRPCGHASRELLSFSPLASGRMSLEATNLVWAGSPHRAEHEPARLGSESEAVADLSAENHFQGEDSRMADASANYANLPIDRSHANFAAACIADVTPSTSGALAAATNWAEQMEAAESGEDSFTVVKHKRRRRESPNRPVEQRSSGVATSRRTGATPRRRPTAGGATVVQEIRATRADIADARVQQRSSTEDNCVFVEHCPDFGYAHYLQAVEELVGGAGNVLQVMKMDGHMLVGLSTKALAERLLRDGLEIGHTHLRAFPFKKRAERITVANLPFFVDDAAVIEALRPYGDVTSIVPIRLRAGRYTFTDGRREVFILLKEGFTLEKIPTRVVIRNKGNVLSAFISYGVKCSRCGRQGHRRANCPINPGRASNNGQPQPAPLPPSASSTVSRQQSRPTPAAPALPMEETPSAPPPVTPAPPLQAPEGPVGPRPAGSQHPEPPPARPDLVAPRGPLPAQKTLGPAAPTPDVEMSIVEETLASSTSSAKNATRVDLDAFIEGHPSVSFAETDALGLGREEVLDLLSSRTKAQRKGPLLSPPQCDALAGLIGQILDLRPGAASNLYKVLGQVKAELRTTPAAVPTPPPPAPRPAETTSPALHGERTSPDIATPPPPLSCQFIDDRWTEADDILHELNQERDWGVGISESDITEAVIYPEDREPLIRRLSTRRRSLLAGFISAAIERARDSDPFVREGINEMLLNLPSSAPPGSSGSAGQEPGRPSIPSPTGGKKSKKIDSHREIYKENSISREYVNPPADGGNASLAAARVDVISGVAATSSSNGAALAIRNWADCDEVVNPGTDDDFTVVKTKKRRCESSNSPTAATPSSNSGRARSGRRVQSSARSVPRAQEIPTTRAHIAEARARQTSSTEDHCVYIERSPELEPYHYMRALDRMLGGTKEVFQMTKMNGHFLVGLANRGLAERLVTEGLEVEGTLHRAFPFRKRAERITVGNLPFFVGDAAVISALSPFGRVTSIAPKLMKAGPYIYNDGRREAFIILREGMTIERLPTRLDISIKGEAWPAYLSSGIRCSRCRGQGHRRANCPTLAGRTTAPGPATPTSLTSVPPATAPRLPQQPSAQPPPPASPSSTMEVSDVPPASRAAPLPPAALRPSPPAPSALPAEDAPLAPPPVTPAALSLRTPGSREPAASTPDVEMSIVEEFSASSTSSAKNATRVDLDAFIEKHPSVSFAGTDALGLGREEVLDLLSSRTKAQRKGPLLSPPQCDAFARLIGQILDLRPGAASNLYKVLGQVKAELRTTPTAVSPTPPLPAPRPAEPTPPAPPGKMTTPAMATSPPPLFQLEEDLTSKRWEEAADIIYKLCNERYSGPLTDLEITEGDITDAVIYPEDREPLLRTCSTQKKNLITEIISAAIERARDSDPFVREGLENSANKDYANPPTGVRNANLAAARGDVTTGSTAATSSNGAARVLGNWADYTEDQGPGEDDDFTVVKNKKRRRESPGSPAATAPSSGTRGAGATRRPRSSTGWAPRAEEVRTTRAHIAEAKARQASSTEDHCVFVERSPELEPYHYMRAIDRMFGSTREVFQVTKMNGHFLVGLASKGMAERLVNEGLEVEGTLHRAFPFRKRAERITVGNLPFFVGDAAGEAWHAYLSSGIRCSRCRGQGHRRANCPMLAGRTTAPGPATPTSPTSVPPATAPRLPQQPSAQPPPPASPSSTMEVSDVPPASRAAPLPPAALQPSPPAPSALPVEDAPPAPPPVIPAPSLRTPGSREPAAPTPDVEMSIAETSASSTSSLKNATRVDLDAFIEKHPSVSFAGTDALGLGREEVLDLLSSRTKAQRKGPLLSPPRCDALAFLIGQILDLRPGAASNLYKVLGQVRAELRTTPAVPPTPPLPAPRPAETAPPAPHGEESAPAEVAYPPSLPVKMTDGARKKWLLDLFKELNYKTFLVPLLGWTRPEQIIHAALHSGEERNDILGAHPNQRSILANFLGSVIERARGDDQSTIDLLSDFRSSNFSNNQEAFDKYANLLAGGKDVNLAAPFNLAANPSSNAVTQAHRNWADMTEDINPEIEDNFTLVQRRKRRRCSANSPTANAPSSHIGGSRTDRRPRSSTGWAPRAEEIRTTRAHIAEARAQQASSSEEYCVYIERSPDLEPFHYLRALDRMVGGTGGVVQVSKLETCPSSWRTLVIINALSKFGRVTSIAPKLMKAGPYIYNDGRREAFIALHEGVTIERLPTRLEIKIKGETWPAYLSSGIRCSRCHGQGHRRAICPLIAGLANSTRMPPPTTPAGVPPPTTPAPPQRSAAQPPAPASSDPALETPGAPPAARAVTTSTAPRPSPPVAPAVPMEEAPSAPPPVTPAPSLQAPEDPVGPRPANSQHSEPPPARPDFVAQRDPLPAQKTLGPAAPTPDVEMSIAETSASSTSSAKNATRVDLDAFIEKHPSVSFAGTDALGLGREEVLDLLSSRTKAQRKGPLLSPPQCDALAGLIGQILDLRPGAASNLYKVLGQVKAELRTTPAVPPTPPLPAPRPSSSTPPNSHSEKLMPAVMTPPPPAPTEMEEDDESTLITQEVTMIVEIFRKLKHTTCLRPLYQSGINMSELMDAVLCHDDRMSLMAKLSPALKNVLAEFLGAAIEQAQDCHPNVGSDIIIRKSRFAERNSNSFEKKSKLCKSARRRPGCKFCRAGRPLAAIPTSNAAAQVRRNWADITEEVNPGAEEGFTLVQGRKRRRGSGNSPTTAAPSSNAGASRTIRRPQSSAGSVPRAQEIRATRAHIADARARQASSSEEHCVYIEHSPELEPFHYLRALDRKLGGTAGVIQITKVNGHQLLGLTNRGLAERLISEGLEVEGTLLRAFPFRKRAERITVGNLPFFVADSAVITALSPFGRVTSIAPKQMKAGPYVYVDGRRDVFITLHEGITIERLPTRLDINIKGQAWPAYLSSGIRCSRCHGQGHRRAICPLLAGLANNTRTAPPTTPAGVPPPTTPAPPQRSAAQPPAPTPSNPAMEVCSAPPVARAALHSSAPRPSPPAAPAFPMEETPPAPPPVTPAPSLQTPGSREPAAPTPDVEMSIVEETFASSTSSAKNATRVDLDAFIEGLPSVSFAKTDALGLGREEVLDLLSSRTKAQRKGPLLSPPQCDALVGLIGQILDLKPGHTSNLYKVLGQVKAELRTTPAVPPTPTLPAPWPAKPTPPALHGEKTSPDIATPPPPLSTEFIDACYDQANDIIYELSDERYLETLSDIGVTEGDIVEAIIFPDDREPLLRRLSTQKRTTLAGIVSAASERARSSDPFVREGLRILSEMLPPPNLQDANSAAPVDLAAVPTSNAAAQVRRNWADITEEVNPGAEEGFTLVQGRKRRRGSANSPTAAAPSSNAGGSRTIRRPQPSARSVPRAQEIPTTRTHITEARARQASSSEEHCVYLEHGPELQPFHYLRALDGLLGGTAGIIQISKVNGHQLLGLANRGLAERLINNGLEVEGTLLRAFPFRKRAERITVSNLPFFVEDSAIINALRPFGRITSIAPKMMKAGPYTYTDSRREAFIVLHEGMTTERLPTRLNITIKGEAWPAYLSTGIKCSRCHGQGHRRANCPLLAGLANNTRTAPPTTPAGVPPPTTPAPPQRSAAQLPAPTPSNPAMEVCSAPPVARAALHSSATRPSPPAAPAFPMEEMPPAPPPVTPAPSLRTPGSREPAAQTPDVEMPIVEETFASSTSSAKNATRVDLDAFIEGHPSVSFAKTDALGLGREEVLDLLSSRTKAQRKGPLLSPPQCDALVGLIGQILDLRPGAAMSRMATNMVWAESPSKAEDKPVRLGSKAQPSAEITAKDVLQNKNPIVLTKNQNYVNPSAGSQDANSAAPVDLAAIPTSDAAAQVRRNWADITEEVNPGAEEGFTLVQGRKRRRGSANSPTAAAPSSNPGGSRTIRRPQPSAGSVPRAQEIRVTRAHIAEARARQASSSEEHCVYIEHSPELEPFHYLRALDRMLGGTAGVIQITKVNGHQLLGLTNRSLAERLISEGLEVEGTLLRAFPFRKRAERITVGNLPFFVADSAVITALSPYGRVTSIAPKQMKAGPYVYVDGRRDVFITLHEGITIERLPTRLDINIKGEAWPAYLSSGIRCSRCHGQGHRRAICPLLAGLANNTRMAPPTTPAGVPPPTTPAPPQRSAAQPPAPTPSNPAMEVCSAPPVARAALHSSAPRPSPPAAPAYPMEETPPAPPPVTPASSLRTPGSREPAAPTPDVEMSIVEETFASSTSSAKNATRVDLDAFIEKHPSVSFAGTDALGLGREEVLDLLSSRTKTQRKGPLLSPPQCDALAGLIRQILNLKPGAASNLYKVLGQVKAELRTTPAAVPPTPPLPAPRPAEPMLPTTHREELTPPLMTPPPPAPTDMEEDDPITEEERCAPPPPAPRLAGPIPPVPHGDTTTPAMTTPPLPLSLDRRWKMTGDLIHELSREIDLEHTFQTQVDMDDIVRAVLYPGDREPFIKRLPTRDRYILSGFIHTAIWRARDGDPSMLERLANNTRLAPPTTPAAVPSTTTSAPPQRSAAQPPTPASSSPARETPGTSPAARAVTTSTAPRPSPPVAPAVPMEEAPSTPPPVTPAPSLQAPGVPAQRILGSAAPTPDVEMSIVEETFASSTSSAKNATRVDLDAFIEGHPSVSFAETDALGLGREEVLDLLSSRTKAQRKGPLLSPPQCDALVGLIGQILNLRPGAASNLYKVLGQVKAELRTTPAEPPTPPLPAPRPSGPTPPTPHSEELMPAVMTPPPPALEDNPDLDQWE
ncbi:hypothetical protein LAZ67_17003108, partial [Cordylochernes scorpioides]